MAGLQEMVDSAGRIVFFGGAGTSTESGIPDFRSADGVFSLDYPYPPEQIVSRSFFEAHPRVFFDFYRAKLLHPEARPNPAHLALAGLEGAGKLLAVITQNIDGLHQMAGSKAVIELHGSVHRNTCLDCGAGYPMAYILAADGVPHCDCGGVVKPDVVLYEEALAEADIRAAVEALRQADLLIIGGTSMAVYPAAGLVRHYRGKDVVVINLGETGPVRGAALVIPEPIGQVLGALSI